jgi:hypothetical protein
MCVLHRFYMNDPHWRGADGKQDTPSSPSPGIAVLASKPDLEQFNPSTWPIANYQAVHKLDKIQEGVQSICSKHHSVFTEDHCNEWNQLFREIPDEGPVSRSQQASMHAKVTVFRLLTMLSCRPLTPSLQVRTWVMVQVLAGLGQAPMTSGPRRLVLPSQCST